MGTRPPNGLGLYDLAGNVWQWTEDCYHSAYDGAPNDGSAWTSGDCSKRVLHGGGRYLGDWNEERFRVAYRFLMQCKRCGDPLPLMA